jgi:hypothetical protein
LQGDARLRAIVLAALAVGMAVTPAPGAERAATFARIRAQLMAESTGPERSAAFDRIRARMIARSMGAAPAANFALIRQQMIAESIGEVMQRGAKSVEVVTFRDKASVTVIRGAAKRPPPVPSNAEKVEIVTFADPNRPPVTVIRGAPTASTGSPGAPWEELFGPARGADLDLVAFAVDGAESSHGADLGMWRPDWSGPQGPMQVSEAAAIDVGGGDRFDIDQNRLLGRAYLAHLFRRYGNWPDAIVAYNWGPGNLDTWIAAGRPPDELPLEVERYRDRVLRDSGLRRGLDLMLPPALPMR